MTLPNERTLFEWVYKLLCVFTLALVFLGFAQFVTKSTLIEVTNSQNLSKFVSADLYEGFRPPSVFSSSFDFGLFCVLTFCISLSFYSSRLKKLSIVGVTVSAIGILLSQTRNVYLYALLCMVAFFLLRRARKRKSSSPILRLLPVINLFIATAVVFVAVFQFLSGNRSVADFGDATSTWARVSNWQFAIQQIAMKRPAYDSLLGFGLMQPGQASDYMSLYPVQARTLFIDNTFMSLFLFQGLLGLLLFIIIVALTWKWLLQICINTDDCLSIGVTAFFSVYLAGGMFNILTYGFWYAITFFFVGSVLQGYRMGRTGSQIPSP